MRILGVSVLGLLELMACAREPEATRHMPEECRADQAARHDRLRLRDAPPVGLNEETASSDRGRRE